MLVEALQALLGLDIPIQFEPVTYVISGLFLLFLVSFFAEFLKLLILKQR